MADDLDEVIAGLSELISEALSDAFARGSDWQKHGNWPYDKARESCVADNLATLRLMANIEADAEANALLEMAETARATGDILADELSVMNHTVGISGRARDALTDWDAVTFKLRTRLLNAKAPDHA